MASIAVSIRASRATWLTHADTSVIAGRIERSSSSTPFGTAGGAASRPAATASSSSRPSGRGVAGVDASRLRQLVEVGRLPLSDAEHGQIGQHLAHG